MLRAIFIILLFALNLLLIPTAVIFVGLIRLACPIASWRKEVDRINQHYLVRHWMILNSLIIDAFIKTKFTISGSGKLRANGKYFLICNHQSWADILILQKVFGAKLPMFIFFMKHELMWTIPIAGLSCWATGFPFMHRYTKEYLKKHPERKDTDIKTVQKFCARFKEQPLTVISFVESTRFTEQKKQTQDSPHKHLLKPKAASVAQVLGMLSDNLQEIINVTIVYDNKKTPGSAGRSLWQFICGKIEHITVHYEVMPIDDHLRGNYLLDRAFRVQFQAWLNQLWKEKDHLIEQLATKNKK